MLFIPQCITNTFTHETFFRISVVMINRLMINLQDPKLFNSASEGGMTPSRTRQPTLGPFVTTVFDRSTYDDTAHATDTDISFTDALRIRTSAARRREASWPADSETGLSPLSSNDLTTSDSAIIELSEMRSAYGNSGANAA